MIAEFYQRDPDIALCTDAASRAMIVEAGCSTLRTGQDIDGIDVFQMSLAGHDSHLKDLEQRNPPVTNRWVQTVTLLDWVVIIDMVDTKTPVRFILAVHPDECNDVMGELRYHLGMSQDCTIAELESWLQDMLGVGNDRPDPDGDPFGFNPGLLF